jgi:hypothetical protein
MHATKRSGNTGNGRVAVRSRGFILPTVMLLCVVLITVAALLLASAQDLAHSSGSIERKNATFDAAEAGLNAALDSLNASQLVSGSTRGSLPNGFRYKYTIYPNLLSSSDTSIVDPIKGIGNVVVPSGSAVIVSVGTDPTGGRPSTVEALIMARSATVNFQKYAIIAGRNVQGSYLNGITDVGRISNALVHANGSINASVSGGIQGIATASGDTNTLPPGRIATPLLALPTVGQFDTLVSNYEDEVKLHLGPTALLLTKGSALASNYSCSTPAPVDGCLLFYDGPLDLTSQRITFDGPWTFVVNGDLAQSATASLTFSGHSGIVVANGNASIEGDGVTNAYVEVKGSTLFGGFGTFSGAIITLGNFTFDSGNSSGAFQFDSNVVPPARTIVGRVKVVTYGEY